MSKEKIQLVNELHKPVRKNFLRRRTIIKGLDDLWQADLAQMDLYAKYNKQFKYFLLVIDCFSKYVWIKPVKNKTGEEVSKVFLSILKESKRSPKHLHTDQGKEFYNHQFQQVMKNYYINHYSTFSRMKAAIAERTIRTIKEKLFKYFSLNGSYKWIDILENIVKNYNEQVHHSIKMKPCDVNKNVESKILAEVYNHPKISIYSKKDFKIGDHVRISKEKHIFEKGYIPNWTTEIFTITNRNLTNPVTYLLEDLSGKPILGSFYQYELQKVKNPTVYLVEKVLKRRGKKAYVKWLGFDKSNNSWIKTSDIL